MTELLFEALEGPITGEGSIWWQLSNDSNDLTNGVLSDGTLYLYPPEFFPTTNSNLLIGNDVERILFPSVNAKFDRQEIFDSFGIPSPDPEGDDNTYSNEELEAFVRDLADTGVVTSDINPEFQTFIEGLEDERFRDPEFSRQPETEGPFTFGTNDFAFADGYYVALNTAELPLLIDGIEVKSNAQLSLGLLEEPPGNALDPLYEIYAGGNFSVEVNYTLNFDFNEIDGGNGKDILIGSRGRDKIEGGNGRDRLTGAGGNDYLDGGNGRDILNGAGGRCSVGTGEIDLLTGGRGRDVFVLGNRHSGAFYLGNDNSDYAVITDFQRNDRIRLGTANFTLSEENTFLGDSGISIFVNNDLVGFVVGASFGEVEAAMRL